MGRTYRQIYDFFCLILKYSSFSYLSIYFYSYFFLFIYFLPNSVFFLFQSSTSGSDTKHSGRSTHALLTQRTRYGCLQPNISDLILNARYIYPDIHLY